MALLVVLAGIAATVLLARDKANLRLVLDRFGIRLAPSTMVIPKPGQTVVFRPHPIKTPSVMIEPYVLAPEVAGLESGLLRSARKNGPDLCDLLRDNGLPVTPWAKSQLGGGMECFMEQVFAEADRPDDPSSFFLMVKGTKEGEFTSARLKIIFSSLAGREQVLALSRKATSLLAKANGWTEFASLDGRISRMEPFVVDEFGLNIRFAAEFGGPGRYNLIITLSAKDAARQRSADYFGRDRFLPLPPGLAAP